MVAIPRSRASRGDRKSTACPSTSIRPASGRMTPETIRPRVDLPAPFSPTSACTEPARAPSDTSLSALVSPKCLETASTRRSSGAGRQVRSGPPAVQPGHSATNSETFSEVTTAVIGGARRRVTRVARRSAADRLHQVLDHVLAFARGQLRDRRVLPLRIAVVGGAGAAVADEHDVRALASANAVMAPVTPWSAPTMRLMSERAVSMSWVAVMALGTLKKASPSATISISGWLAMTSSNAVLMAVSSDETWML